MSEDQRTERSTRLVVGEPPETADGKLMAILDLSNDTVIRLKCGLFTSLGYPPVSALWKDPTGQILASTGFTGSHFTLDLPVHVARSGHYCCHLDCRDPKFCCLDDRSPLKQCAPIDVNTDSKTDNHERPTEESALVKNMELDRLERRVSAIDTIVQELERSERQQTSQMCVAAMFYQVQREAKCEQLDSAVDKLLKVEGELWGELNATRNNLSIALQHSTSVETTLKEAFVGQQHKAESLMTKVSGELTDVKSLLSVSGQVLDGLQTTVNEDVINYLYNINQTTENLQARIESGVASVDDRVMETLKEELAQHQHEMKASMSSLSDELIQTKSNLPSLFQQSVKAEIALKAEFTQQQRMMEAWMLDLSHKLNQTNNSLSTIFGQCCRVQPSLKEELIKQQHSMETWMSRLSDELNIMKTNLSTTLTQSARVQDTLQGELTRHRHETSRWMSKVSGDLNEMNETLATFGKLVAALDKKTESLLSEVNTKIASIDNSLRMHVTNTATFQETLQTFLSSLNKTSCAEMGYTVLGRRCLKYYATKTDYASAGKTCAADGGHLVHLKSRQQDLPPFLALLTMNERQLVNLWSDGLWVGADDISTEGAFTWSDGTDLPKNSDLWGSGQPDDYGRREDCVQAVLSLNKLVLNDYPCSHLLDFVCQVDLVSL